jgi:undecaprenyl-diphosphatase
MGEWLESLVPWGTEVLVAIQSGTHEWPVAFFVFLTNLGHSGLYLALALLFLWCVDKQIGVGLGYLSLFSTWLNSVVKYLFAIPRPSDPRLIVPLPETNPSFPSGHAQNAVATWGYLALRLRNRIVWAVVIAVIVGIGLSRMALGVHFPQDVIGGWLIGLALLGIFAWAETPVRRFVGRQKTAVQLLLAIGVPVALIFLHPAGAEGRYPAEEAITPMSFLVGLGVGLIMERAWVRSTVEGEWWRRGLRYVSGMVLVLALYAGPRLFLPEQMGSGGGEGVLIFAQYALVGWVAAFLAPWLFVKLRLAGQEPA